jgi:hypothetical protein
MLMDKGVVDLLSKLFTPEATLITLLILGAVTTLYTAIIKFFFERRLKSLEHDHADRLAEVQARLSADTQRGLKELEAELVRKTQTELQKSQAAITEVQAEQQSRRDYQHEARKRLYHEFEPLIFELMESSENATDRIRGIARSARRGDLPGWFLSNEYYIASTMYYLIVPVAVYKLMRRRLTAVDLRLDSNIATLYRFTKQIAWCFTDDFALAKDKNLPQLSLDYTPNDRSWEERRREGETGEKKFWRQGIPYGRLDNAAECLIVREYEPDGDLRIVSFGEFESEWHKAGSNTQRTFAIVQDVFTGFHPRTRPVLWRILIAQAHLYYAILRFHQQTQTVNDMVVINSVPAEDRGRYRWTEEADEQEWRDLEAAFCMAEAYFQKHLPPEMVALTSAGTVSPSPLKTTT